MTAGQAQVDAFRPRPGRQRVFAALSVFSRESAGVLTGALAS